MSRLVEHDLDAAGQSEHGGRVLTRATVEEGDRGPGGRLRVSACGGRRF
ncbi:MAG TPA: hypothetical protein VGG06_04050 [Thermoanaerobaculia bacterium]